MMPLLNAIRLTLSANMQTTPSASYSLTLRVKLSSRAGTLGQVATAIGRAGRDIGAIDIVSVASDFITRDITVNAASSEHALVPATERNRLLDRARSRLPCNARAKRDWIATDIVNPESQVILASVA